jgi:hypothetical protein
MNVYHTAGEHVCYGCDGPREINPAGSIPGITNYKPCSACGAIGIKRKGGFALDGSPGNPFPR